MISKFGLLLLGGIYLGTAFGPTPADAAVAVSALALWVVVPLARWIDGRRVA